MYYQSGLPSKLSNADYTKISDSSIHPTFLLFDSCALEANEIRSRSINNMSISSKASAGHFTILYFASASSYTSKDSEILQAPLPLSKLFETLEERYPGIKAKVLESCLVTVNLEYVDVTGESAKDQTIIQEGDEVAIIPPVSSG
jgi:molybdopterin converting factor small subunit